MSDLNVPPPCPTPLSVRPEPDERDTTARAVQLSQATVDLCYFAADVANTEDSAPWTVLTLNLERAAHHLALAQNVAAEIEETAQARSWWDQ